MKFLLDTNVVSELGKPRPRPRVVAWSLDAEHQDCDLSVITVGELRSCFEKLRPSDPL